MAGREDMEESRQEVMGRRLGGRVMPYVLVLMGLFSQTSSAGMSIMIGIGALVMIRDLVRDRASFFRVPFARRLCIVAALFAASLFVTSLFSMEPARSFRENLSTLSRMLPLFFALFYVRSWRCATAILAAFAVSTAVNDVAAVVQAVRKVDTGWGTRPIGLVHSPTFLGSFMLLSMPLLVFPVALLPLSRKWKLFFWGVAALSFAVLLLSMTRGAWLAFACVAVSSVFFCGRYRVTVLKGLAVLLLAFGMIFFGNATYGHRAEQVFDDTVQSETERYLMWQSAYRIFEDHPIVGIGQDEFGLAYNRDYLSPQAKERPRPDDPRSGHGHPHNNFMKVLSERGLVGMACFLLLHGAVFVALLRMLRQSKSGKAYLFALAGTLAFIGIHLEGLTDTNLQLTHIARTYWLLMGLCLAAGQMKDEDVVKMDGER